MVDCDVCNEEIEETILDKIDGFYLKDDDGDIHTICSDCQKEFKNDKEKLLENV